MSQSPIPLLILITTVTALVSHAGDVKPKFNYPEDLRKFRKKALYADGPFAPDIAFTVRTCPKCQNPYAFGNFPRLSRQPFNALSEVHAVVEAAASRTPPSTTMFVPSAGRELPRACPNCGEPEGRAARADRVLFCHVLPDCGDDMQIDYVLKDRAIVSKTFYRMPKTPLKAGPRLDNSPEALAEESWGPAQKVELSDESEDSLRKAFGEYFSLREVWRTIIAGHWDRNEVFYREISPGMFFVFRPKGVDVPDFGKFTGIKLMPDKKEGLFDRLESPLTIEEKRPYPYGTPFQWLKADLETLTNGKAEIFVGINYEKLRQAAVTALAARRMTLEFKSEDGKPTLEATLSNGHFKTEVNLFPLCHDAATAGTSLAQTAALFSTEPVYALDSAERLREKILRARPACRWEIKDGRVLVLEDRTKAKRSIDLFKLADKFEFENDYLFGMYLASVLEWDEQKGAFGAERTAKDLSPIGFPAFVMKRIRPLGFLKSRDLPEALTEDRADAKGKHFELCYTWECPATLAYIDPKKEAFKDFTLDEAKKKYEATAGLLPFMYAHKDSLFFPGDGRRVESARATFVLGSDVASAAADPALAWALALSVGSTGNAETLQFYAPFANAVVLAPRALTEDELKIARSRLTALLADQRIDSGAQLDLHFDLPQTPPRGKVFRRTR